MSQKKTKKTLLEELNERGLMLQPKQGYSKAELQDLASSKGIVTNKQIDKILTGWKESLKTCS